MDHPAWPLVAWKACPPSEAADWPKVTQLIRTASLSPVPGLSSLFSFQVPQILAL